MTIHDSDDEPVVKKSKGGRPRGSRNSVGGRTPPPAWLRELVYGCFTRQEWADKFRSLPTAQQLDIATRLQPRDLKIDSESTVRFLITGSLPAGDDLRRELVERKAAHALPPSTEADAVDAAHADYFDPREEER